MKLPIITECPDCQALADRNVLFLKIESIAKQQNVAPDRMANALRELYAMWQALATAIMADSAVRPDEIERLAQRAATAVREQFSTNPQGHVH